MNEWGNEDKENRGLYVYFSSKFHGCQSLVGMKTTFGLGMMLKKRQ